MYMYMYMYIYIYSYYIHIQRALHGILLVHELG